MVRIQRDGDVVGFVGSTPGGQGHRTVFAQILADHLGWPLERVQVYAGDSALVAQAAVTAGSRSALEVGNAIAAAAKSARARLLERGRARLEVATEDLDVGPEGVRVRGAPSRGVALAELLEGDRFLDVEDGFQSNGAYTSAVHVAVLDVDPETAAVRIQRYAIAHDCGQAINPLLVNGQLQGGLVHGLGYALMEEAVYLEDGTLVTANFADYALPGRGVAMEVQPRLVEVQTPVLGNNPEGFKGVGETGTIAAPAAVVAALEDALRQLGVDANITTLPVTPRRLFALLYEDRPLPPNPLSLSQGEGE
jgi:carbon-monoxide dehydrogenase large subunit